MKTLRILFALFTTVIILTACTTDGISTNEGGETSLTTILPNKAYGLSDVTKKEIKENKDTIIITESIDVSHDDTRDMPEKSLNLLNPLITQCQTTATILFQVIPLVLPQKASGHAQNA